KNRPHCRQLQSAPKTRQNRVRTADSSGCIRSEQEAELRPARIGSNEPQRAYRSRGTLREAVVGALEPHGSWSACNRERTGWVRSLASGKGLAPAGATSGTESPDPVALLLGEPQAAVRAGGDAVGATVARGQRELGQQALQRDAPNSVAAVLHEP